MDKLKMYTKIYFFFSESEYRFELNINRYIK